MSDELASVILADNNGCILKCRVQPRSSQNRLIGVFDGALKIKLKAPPVDGKANELLIKFLAKTFHISRSSISLSSGKTSKIKAIAIRNLSKPELLHLLKDVFAS